MHVSLVGVFFVSLEVLEVIADGGGIVDVYVGLARLRYTSF
uniref:Uncharacterized protein n=1 Tax=blood disease bacterium R229 TaxID=741978 RepID=G2ZS84_9RALS|nr:hypothetical protein BDB_160144 [blood disease bacterium R229]